MESFRFNTIRAGKISESISAYEKAYEIDSENINTLIELASAIAHSKKMILGEDLRNSLIRLLKSIRILQMLCM